MNQEMMSNATIWSTDFSRKERIVFLSSLQKPTRCSNACREFCSHVQDACMTEVVVADEDTKALQSPSGQRVAWWRLQSFIHRLSSPLASDCEVLDRIEHRQQQRRLDRQQRQTIHRRVAQTMRQFGLLAGIRCALRQMRLKRGR